MLVWVSCLLLIQSLIPWALVHAETMVHHQPTRVHAHCPSMDSAGEVKAVSSQAEEPMTHHPSPTDEDPLPIESVCERACALVQVSPLFHNLHAPRHASARPPVRVWVSHHAYPAKIPTPPPIS